MMSFGIAPPPGKGSALWREGDAIALVMARSAGRISLAEFKFPGGHNVANAMAARPALAMGIEPAVIERALAEARGLPHRIETVGEKMACVLSTILRALTLAQWWRLWARCGPPVILLAGGVDKGGDYAPLMSPCEKR